jgi:hypothetical protein
MRADRSRVSKVSPSSALGADHPLVRVTARLDDAVCGSVAVSAVLVVGVVAAIRGLAIGVPLALTAAAAVLALLGVAGSLAAARRHSALELIAQGREALPLRAVARERRRLLEPDQRERLARSIDVIRVEAGRSAQGRQAIRLAYDVAAVRASSSEMAGISGLVRDGGGVRGLAATELLVIDSDSPLYDSAGKSLHRELGRIAFLLAAQRRPM